MPRRDVQISGDANSAVIATGDGNTFYLVADPSTSQDLLARIQRGEIQPAELPKVDPLPHLTLQLRSNGNNDPESGESWTLTPLVPTSERQEDETFLLPGESRPWVPPWQGNPTFGRHLHTYWKLTERVVSEKSEQASLHEAARALGAALAATLLPEEIERLEAIGRSPGGPPFLILDAEDDLILSLPWELLRFGDRWPVFEGRLDLARTIPAVGAAGLAPPTEPLSLLVNVSAPRDSSPLNYEAESYRISRALQDHAAVAVNEMGELEDLVIGLSGESPPLGVHFSGHGGPGTLYFEDEYGRKDDVAVVDLLNAIRRDAKLPRLFYLACCHGNTPPSLRAGEKRTDLDGNVTSSAAQLHRDGVPQVVGHFGPVYDKQATEAEEAFYRRLGQGRRTRVALRAARQAMAEPLTSALQASDATRDRRPAGGGPSGTTPYAWAQMVLYHRGPDHPLGQPVRRRYAREKDTPLRRKALPAFEGSRTQVLHHGFIGRRSELHRLRRDLDEGRHLHVVQGLGGLGKSVFCQQAMALYRKQGRLVLALWCADVEGAADPVTALVQQFQELAVSALGPGWTQISTAIDQQIGLVSSGERLATFLRALLEHPEVPPLALYLDNLESLMTSPEDVDAEDPEAAAGWRDETCGELWGDLVACSQASGGQLALLASCRYRSADLARWRFEFPALGPDALFRMMGWFDHLRQLSAVSKARLTTQLAGHPRAVEMLDPLIGQAIEEWKQTRGALPEVETEDEARQEWTDLVAPALPPLDEKLRKDLLFSALWNNVLGDSERRALVRLTVLRRPADWDLLLAVGTPDTPPDESRQVVKRLLASSLVGEFQTQEQTLTFGVHSTILRWVLEESDEAQALRQNAYQVAAKALETRIEAAEAIHLGDLRDRGHYLANAGEVNAAVELLLPVAQDLSADLGRHREGLELLDEIATVLGQASLRSQGVTQCVKADCMIGLGDLSVAQAALEGAIRIFAELVSQDMSNAAWQRDLSVSHNKVGDVLLAQGDLEGALSAFRGSLVIRERLASKDVSNAVWQRDLSVSRNKVGDVLLAQGDFEGALSAFRGGLVIAERLASQDVSTAVWRRDLSVIHNKVGDVLLAQGDLEGALSAFRVGLVIRERLASKDVSNVVWQRDLSVGHNKVGDVLLVQGDFEGALSAFRAALLIRERLASKDVSNAVWQRDLSASHNRVGEVLLAQGDLEGALVSFRADLVIAARLASLDVSNAGWQRDLSVSHERAGDVLLAQGDFEGALSAFRRGLDIAVDLNKRFPTHPGFAEDRQHLEARIEGVENLAELE